MDNSIMEERFSNHLERNDDPDFDLDAYIAEQSQSDYHTRQRSHPEAPQDNRRKSLGVLLIALAVMALWRFDWSPKQINVPVISSGEGGIEVQTSSLPLSREVIDELRLAKDKANEARVLQRENLERLRQLNQNTLSPEQAREFQASLEKALEGIEELELIQQPELTGL